MAMQTDLEMIECEITGHLHGRLSPEDASRFDADSRLRDFGIDSFALVELLLVCEERFGIRIDDSELTPENLQSVSALARCIARAREVT